MKKQISIVLLMFSSFGLQGMEPVQPETNNSNKEYIQHTKCPNDMGNCAICFESTQDRTPCCKQIICLSCWNTPVKGGDVVFQNVEVQMPIASQAYQICPICRRIKTEQEFNAKNNSNANLLPLININNNNNALATEVEPINVPAQQHTLCENEVESKDRIETLIQLTIANQSAKIISAFLATQHGGLLQPELIAPGTFVGPRAILKNGHSFITTRRGTFVLAPDNVVKPTIFNLIHFEESADESQNKVVQQFPNKLLKGLMLLIGNDYSIHGLQQYSHFNQFKDSPFSISENDDNRPLPPLPEAESINILGFVTQVEAAKADNNGKVQVENSKIISPQEMLYEAIMRDSADEIAVAIECGANVNTTFNNKVPLVVAILLRRSIAVAKLVESGADVNVSYSANSLVHHAVRLGDIKSAIILVKNNARFAGNIDQNQNVMNAAIAYVANPPYFENKDGKGIFTMPETTLEFIQLLITKGWNIHNHTDGYIGSCSKNERITNIWWESIGLPNRQSIQLLELFIKNGADPNQVIYNSGFIGASWTPLLRAVERHDKDAVKILLAAGADINKKAKPRYFQVAEHSPLSFAIKIGDNSMIELLMQHGATL